MICSELRALGKLMCVLALGLLLAACGSDDGGEAAPAPSSTTTATDAAGGGDVVVAALGDSITAGTPLWAPDPAARELLGAAADERSQWEYWAAQADPRLVFNNCGVNGERTDEIALRLEECVAGSAPGSNGERADVLIVQGGINDIAQGAPVADAAENLRGMVEAGLDAGLEVALAEVLPWNNGHPDADPEIAELNDEIAAIGEEEGVPVLPFHGTLEDPGQPGVMRADWTIEGDHPSVEGYRLLGEQAVAPNLPGAG